MIKLLTTLLCLFVSTAFADEYWEVQVRNINQAQADAAQTSIQGLDQTGVTIMLQAWSPDDNVFRLGVGGTDLSSFKTALRNAVQSEYGKLPEFDVVRETPNEMSPKARVCSGSDVAAGYNRTINAYFGADMRDVPDAAYTNWINPGDDYCRVRLGTNCDGTDATTLQINAAASIWSNMNQCNRWRIRLHHEGTVYPHESIAKVEVQFSDRVPWTRRADLQACLVADEFEYLGSTYSEACARLNARTPGLCDRFTGFSE